MIEERGEDSPERAADELEEAGDRLDQEIEETKRDWKSKQESSAVAGAVEPDESDEPDEPQE